MFEILPTHVDAACILIITTSPLSTLSAAKSVDQVTVVDCISLGDGEPLIAIPLGLFDEANGLKYPNLTSVVFITVHSSAKILPLGVGVFKLPVVPVINVVDEESFFVIEKFKVPSADALADLNFIYMSLVPVAAL